MTEDKIKIAFFGSSYFSCPFLDIILKNKNFHLKKIITKEEKKQNRGHKLEDNVVYKKAIENGFNSKDVITLNSLKNNPDLETLLTSLDLDFIIVIAYGLIIPNWIINLPRFKILNLHPSCLPLYRGAMPIERAIENGDDDIDICIIELTQELDAGNVFGRIPFKIANKHCNEVYFEIATIGGNLMIDLMLKIKEKPQNKGEMQIGNSSYAKKINKDELQINWNHDAIAIFNKIRAFNMHGGMYFIYDNKRIKIFHAEFQVNDKNFMGFIKNPKNSYFQCQNGIIIPKVIQVEGKNKISANELLHNLDPSKILYNR